MPAHLSFRIQHFLEFINPTAHLWCLDDPSYCRVRWAKWDTSEEVLVFRWDFLTCSTKRMIHKFSRWLMITRWWSFQNRTVRFVQRLKLYWIREESSIKLLNLIWSKMEVPCRILWKTLVIRKQFQIFLSNSSMLVVVMIFCRKFQMDNSKACLTLLV